jgi:hypothetical protein
MRKKSKDARFVPPANSNRPTLEEFVRMVERHDPTHVWSRDETLREAGEQERKIIDKTRDRLGDEVAVPVWNRAMHKKIVPSMIEEFLWTVRRKNKRVVAGVA